MGLFTREYKYKVIRNADGTVEIKPKDVDTAMYEFKQKKRSGSLDSAAKEFQRKERNKRVDARRARLKKIANRVGGGFKKTGKYLSETKLAEQGRERNKKSSGRYRFEDKNDWL